MHDPRPHLPLSPQVWRKVRWICVITGAWGVLTAYPLFVLISEKSDALEGPPVIVRFFGVLVVALVVISMIEWLRDTIRGEGDRSRSIATILISILLLAVFEVFVIAYEEMSQVGFATPYVLTDIAARVSGQQTPYAFLDSGDIQDPDLILQRLRDGLSRPEHSSPAAWIVNDFARETQWTLFPDAVDRPPGHDALVARLMAVNRLPPHEAAPTLLPDGPPSLFDQALGRVGTRQSAPDTSAPPPQPPPAAADDQAGSGNPLFDGLDIPEVTPTEAPPGSVQPPDAPDEENDALMRKLDALARADQSGADPAFGGRPRATAPPTAYVYLGGGRPTPISFAERAGRDLTPLEVKVLLAVELNRQLLYLDFYQPDAFRSVGAEVDIVGPLQRHREALYEGDEAARRLAELEQAPREPAGERTAGATRRELERRVERSGAVLLPLRRVVSLNRRLLESAFPNAITPAEKRTDPRQTSLLVLGVLWILAGGVLGWALATAIRRTHEGWHRPVKRAGARGLLAGVVLVPAAVVGYVLVVRAVNVVRDMWTFRGELSSLFDLEGASYSFRTSWLAPIAIRLEQVGDHLWLALIGFVLFLGCIAAGWVVLWFLDISRLRRNLIISAAAVVVFVNVLLFDLNLMFIFVLVGLVWAIPSLFLGMSTPYLQAGSALPRTWGWIAISSGLILILLTLLRLIWPALPWWLGVVGVLLCLTGFLMKNGTRVEDYWPLAALVLAFAVYGATAIAQKATFHGVLANVHDLSVRGGSDIDLWSRAPEPYAFGPYEQLASQLSESRFTGDSRLDETVDRLEEQHHERLKQERTSTARRLELSIVGSLGFWLTVGLLAAWAVARPPTQDSRHLPP